MGIAVSDEVDPFCPADGGLFTVRDRLIASDTTFIYTAANGCGVTLVGRGFRYDGSGRRLVAGCVKTMIVCDAESHEALVTLECLSIEVVDAMLAGGHAVSGPTYRALARAAERSRTLQGLAESASTMLDRLLASSEENGPVPAAREHCMA